MEARELEALLRGFSTEEVLAPFVEAVGESGFPIYVSPNVIRDGHVIPDRDALELLSTPGAYHPVPFIAGTNREESKLFFAFASPHVSTTFGMPSGFENERMYDLEGEYGGLVWRAQGADEPVRAMRGVQGLSVWAYRFDWDDEGSLLGLDLSKLLGAAHGLDLIFVFGLTDMGFANGIFFDDRESAIELSRQMRSYWANFAHTGRPGRGQAGDLPEWPAWGLGAGEPKYMILDSESGGGLRPGLDEIDQAGVLEMAEKDPRLRSDEERCAIYRNMVQWSSVLTVEAYEEVAGGICRDHPLESRLFFPSLSYMNDPGAG
jgi:para-nitrobenzyl esterase